MPNAPGTRSFHDRIRYSSSFAAFLSTRGSTTLPVFQTVGYESARIDFTPTEAYSRIEDAALQKGVSHSDADIFLLIC